MKIYEIRRKERRERKNPMLMTRITNKNRQDTTKNELNETELGRRF